MRQKIQDIMNGKFEYDDVQLILPEGRVQLVVPEKESKEGSFYIKSSQDVPIRGLVTSTHPHMKCLTGEFHGTSATIHYRYENEESLEGIVDRGSFVFTTNVGEYTLDFSVKITRDYMSSSIGKIKTINDFTNLSKLNWEEALSLFQSRNFDAIFHKDADFYHMLYQGLTYRDCGSHEMEEFLVASGKKRRNTFRLAAMETEFQFDGSPIQDMIGVTKSEWGYVNISITCDAPFIQLKKHRLQMYDFAGKHATVSYVIRPEGLHAGNNYARVVFTYGFQQESIVITVSKKKALKDPYAHYKKLCYSQMELHYLAYLRGEYTAEEWVHETKPLLHKLESWEPDNHLLPLYGAYMYLVNEKPEEAKKSLSALPRNFRFQKSIYQLYFQYVNRNSLKASLPRDFVSRVKDFQKKYPGDPLLMWLLLQSDESLIRNPMRAYQSLRQYISYYSASPVFFQAAADILLQVPDLFDGNEAFDLRLISWMGRRKLLSEKLALRIQAVASNKREYEDDFFRVLTRCSRMFPKIDMVKTICVYLIKTSRYGDSYFSWFQKGVEQHLKVAGLYEAYMLSWNRSNGELPAEIIKYFSMNSALPSKRKAQLFAYVVRNKERLGQDWNAYMELVKDYATAELSKGNMSDDLAIIYGEIRKMIPDVEWNQIKGNSEYCYKLHAKDETAAFVRILWHYPDIRQQRTPMVQDRAFVYLFHRPVVILFEDNNGNVYAAKDSFRLSKLLAGNSIYDEEVIQHGSAQANAKQDPDVRLILENFCDTLDHMAEWIRKAEDLGMSVQGYKEQLMVRMLFTGHLCHGHNDIFRALKDSNEAESLLIAYASLLSRNHILNHEIISEDVYRFIELQIRSGKKVNNYCELAFLSTYASRWDTTCIDSAARILQKYIFRNVYLDCYKQLPDMTQRRYMLMGMEGITYVSPGQQSLYVQVEGRTKEMMVEVVDGLFTYPVSMMPEQSLDYTILDAEDNILYRGVVISSKASDAFADSRYGKIVNLDRKEVTNDEIYEYAGLCDMAETLFIPIEE